MYVKYKVNIFENQVNTLKDAIRLKKGATLCFPKGGIRGDHVLLLTPVQICINGRQVAENVSYTGGFLGMLTSLATCPIPLAARAIPACQDLLLVYFLVVLTKQLMVVEMELDSIYTNSSTEM